MKAEHEKQSCNGETKAVQPSIMATIPTLSSDMLFAGNTEVMIVHGTDCYRLRLTRQSRLILAK